MTAVVAQTTRELHRLISRPGLTRPRVALVPTMGSLHDGHLTHIEVASKHAELVVVSVFVNPLQFGPAEDLMRYPRSLEADVAAALSAGAGVVFAPGLEEMYPDGEPQVTIDPGPIGAELEGAARPGHFRGVLTVVAKLFGIVRPDVATFGEKDYQQLVLVERMVSDLCLRVDIVKVPTVRETDGLALSSRNGYLSGPERERALVLSHALRAGQTAEAVGGGAVRTAAAAVLRDVPGVDVDYVELRGEQLGEAPVAGPARLLVAARVGSTRLIDNCPIRLGSKVPR